MSFAGAPLWKPCGNCFVQILGGRNRGADWSRSRTKVVRKLLNIHGLFVCIEEGLVARPVGLVVPRFSTFAQVCSTASTHDYSTSGRRNSFHLLTLQYPSRPLWTLMDSSAGVDARRAEVYSQPSGG
jgi:hypothetical protein